MNRPRLLRRNKVVLSIVLLLLVALLVTTALGVAWFDELQKIPILLNYCPHSLCNLSNGI